MATDYRNSSTPHTPSLQIAALVLTCINCLCGLALSTRILINAYRSRTTSRDIEKGGLRTSPGWWELLGGRELFPLVFGMAVGVHAAMLLLVQGVGMESGYGDCKAWASVAWTGKFWIWPGGGKEC